MSSCSEYESLRQEILELFDREFSAVTVGLTAAGAIIGFGLTQDKPNALIFLAPLFVLSLTLLQLKQCHYSIIQIAVYIRENLENKGWESYMSFQRGLPKNRNPEDFITSFTMGYNFVAMTIGAGIVSILFSLLYAPSLQQDTNLTLVISIYLISLIYFAYVAGNVFHHTRTQVLLKHEKALEKLVHEWKGDYYYKS